MFSLHNTNANDHIWRTTYQQLKRNYVHEYNLTIIGAFTFLKNSNDANRKLFQMTTNPQNIEAYTDSHAL
jgi:hypothetical protein